MIILARFATLLLLFACAVAPARADNRIALVIGNSIYSNADTLSNPVRDAGAVRAALKIAGFRDADIVGGDNLDKRAMEEEIARFAVRARDADLALAYFAGHGATFNNTPYIVPTTAKFEHLDAMPLELVEVDLIAGILRTAKGVGIALLDACRDNTAETRLKLAALRSSGQAPRGEIDVPRGLAPPRNSGGIIVAYSTQYLKTASDGKPGDNSPFTAALVKHLPRPGIDVKQMLLDVGYEVEKSTAGAQQPEIKVSFFRPYVLVPAKRPPTLPEPTQPNNNSTVDGGRPLTIRKDPPSSTAIDRGQVSSTTDVAMLSRIAMSQPALKDVIEVRIRDLNFARNIEGYVIFGLIDPQNIISKTFFDIEGEKSSRFPVSGDTIVCRCETGNFFIRPVPAHWDEDNNRYASQSSDDQSRLIVRANKLRVASEPFVTKDPFRTDGSLQVVAPIESISGPPVASPKQRATPVYVRNTVSSRFLGYLNIGLLSNDLNSLSNPNFTNSRSPRVYPVANDVWIANNPTNLRVGPRYKLSNGANYVNPPLVPGIAINAGDLVTIGGDVAITSNGLSIWAPISAVAAKTQ